MDIVSFLTAFSAALIFVLLNVFIRFLKTRPLNRLSIWLNDSANFLSERGSRRLAVLYYSVSHLLRKHDLVILYNIAAMNAGSGDLQSAKKKLKKILRIAPYNPDANQLSASISEVENDFNSAVTHLERNIEFNPGFLPSYLSLGQYYLNIGATEQAISMLELYKVELHKKDASYIRSSWLQEKQAILEFGLAETNRSVQNLVD